jgi:hypothetical protein
MAVTFSQIHGFSDLPDTLFEADNPAFGDMVQAVAENGEFAFVHLEVFEGIYVDGDTVPLPTSPIDGYEYSRDELLYVWNPELSTNQSTGWIQSGSGSLFFCAWNVDQSTGLVNSLEWYRNNGSGGSRTQTNDGQIRVYTVAQRQRSSIILASTPSWNSISSGDMAIDEPFTQDLAQHLNDNAKFAAIATEVFYCGEFYNGQTVGLGTMVSPYDGYAYGYSEAKFIACWKWTTDGTQTTVVQPPENYGQMGPFFVSVSGSGAVSCSVNTNDNDGNVTFPSNYGRVAVFAFCRRSGTPGSLATSTSISEFALTTFASDKTLRAGNVQQMDANNREAVLTPEFFGPTVYNNGDTVPVPTSPVDGYTYSRGELEYVWTWAGTKNVTPNGGRLPVFYGSVNASTGAVTLKTWRLASHYVDDHDDGQATVIVVARRGLVTPTAITGTVTSSPSDITTSTLMPATDIDPYAITFDMGGGRTSPPGSLESLLKHAITSNLTSVTLASGLSGSVGGCRTAPTGSYVITIKVNGTSVGSVNIAASATTATFTLSATQTLNPGDIVEFVAQSTADATILGIFFTISGLRNQ